MGHLSIKVSLMLVAFFGAACASQSSAALSSNPPSMPVTTTGTTSPSNRSNSGTRDPQVIVDELDAAGLALCHSDYSDGAQYNIYGILGATATWRFFPHHTAVAMASDNGEALSCVSPNQPNTGVIEIDVYLSRHDARAALRQVGQLWLYAWLYGNVAIHIDQSTPTSVTQAARDVLDHLAGTTEFP
jgi:hypothetical protein